MNWQQYEVWSEDDLGHQEIVETTASKKEALALAQRVHNETKAYVTVYQETSDGDYEMIKEFK
jgi:hypothetical protein